MKIFFASQSFYPLIGGVSTYLINLAVGLKKHGHEVAEIHLRPPYEGNEDKIKGIEVHRVPKEPLDLELLEKYSKFKEAVYTECHGRGKVFNKKAEDFPGFEEYYKINEVIGKQLTELLSDHPAQIVHIHDFQLLLLHKFIPRGIPLVFTWHIPFSKKMSKNLSRFLIENLNAFDKVIFSNKGYIDNAVSMGLPRKKTRLLYPLTNTNLFRPLGEKKKLRKNYGLPLNSKIVLCVQRIDPKSGHEQLVRAFPNVLEHEPSARLVFVGGESLSNKISKEREKYVDRIKSLVKKLGLAKKVFFMGNIDYEKMPEIYATADLVALTSKQEGFGLAVTEGMSCGKPIIGTRTTGIKFQVEHGKNGYLVKIGDYRETAEKIVKILSDEKLAEKMGARSLEIVKKKFQTDKGITKHIELYSKLLREKNSQWCLKRLDPKEISAMVLDFDRTLTKKPGKLDLEAFRELKSLKKHVIIATGRNINFVREFSAKHKGLKAIVAENGAVIFFPKEKKTISIDSDAMHSARKKLRKAFPDLSIGKVVVHAPAEMEHKLREAIGGMKGLKFVKNIDRVMLMPNRVDKGKGVLLALHLLGVEPEKTIIVGDGENDVDLFSVPGFRVAVANAVPKLKALADQVTEKESAKGVIEIVQKLKQA